MWCFQVYQTHKIGESKIIWNNKLKKSFHMKYNGNIDSCQLQEKIKNSWIYKIFLHRTPLKNYLTKNPIFMHLWYQQPLNYDIYFDIT